MSEKQKNSEKASLLKKFLFLFLKQVAASLICLAIAVFMKHSNIPVLNNCANALNLAIEHNPNWEETVKEAFSNFKNNSLERDIK